jgi:hypothetical protein
MLSERCLELLTAYVDGELTRRQRKAALRLLHRSSEARSILQDFQENAHKLRELPHPRLETAFARQVLQAIADRGLQPSPGPQPVLRRKLPRRLLYAAAAGIMLAVGLGIYLVATGPHGGALIAVRPEDKPELLPDPIRIAPLHMAFNELAEPPKRARLVRQLQTESAVHLTVTVRHNVKALAQLEDVLKGQGINPIVDARTQANLQKGQGNADYFVYAENVSAEELETILRQLAGQPKNEPAQKDIFESMVVTSLSQAHRQNLSELMGIDASDLDAPVRHDVFKDTFIEGPRDKSPKTSPGPLARPERYAMVLAGDLSKGGSSAQVKSFLAKRQQHRPGTVQVLLVIHQA